MSTITKQILEKALVLPAAERAELVESLLASLDQPDARTDELWAKEAEDRLAAFKAGQTKACPAHEVLQEFAEPGTLDSSWLPAMTSARRSAPGTATAPGRSREFVEVLGMRGSVLYQRILQEGRDEGFAPGFVQGHAEGRDEGHVQGLALGQKIGGVEVAARILWRLGTRRFGSPSDPIRAALHNLEDVERLVRLCERVHEVESWDELLAQP